MEKVGLVKGPLAPSPFKNPCAKVVLPEPKLPERQTIVPGLIFLAIRFPKSLVFSAFWVIILFTFFILKETPKKEKPVKKERGDNGNEIH